MDFTTNLYLIGVDKNTTTHTVEQYGGCWCCFKHNRQNEGRKAGMRRRSLSQGHQNPFSEDEHTHTHQKKSNKNSQ